MQSPWRWAIGAPWLIHSVFSLLARHAVVVPVEMRCVAGIALRSVPCQRPAGGHRDNSGDDERTKNCALPVNCCHAQRGASERLPVR